MELLIGVVTFFTSATIVFCLGYLIVEKGMLVRRRGPLEGWPEIERALVRLGRLAPRPERATHRIEQSLTHAGYRKPSAPALFYGVSALSTVLTPGLVGLVLLMRGQWTGRALTMIGAATILGYLAPRWALRARVRARQEKLRRALPQALDLMVISVGAGLGLDQTLATVSKHLTGLYPEMAEELALVILEMRAGRPRAEAFHALARRTGLDEMRSLAATLVQADQLGTSISDALRNAADELRIRRRQQAEEMAAKIPVKLVFPIFFFIFPGIFIVTAGPAVLRLIRELLPVLRG